uniref:Uncharacterized protein n=1 Tax=Arundo donax TaxID=35708 RepID=A0A0A9G2M1_ARUDO
MLKISNDALKCLRLFLLANNYASLLECLRDKRPLGHRHLLR